MAQAIPSAHGIRLADTVLSGGRFHSMAADGTTHGAVAVREGRIVAVATAGEGLDDLVTADVRRIDARGLTFLPAFYDAHEHLFDFAQNLDLIQPSRAHSIAELVGIIRERAEKTPTGQWIQTAMGWNEMSLAEHRLPTAAELDQATTRHPVLVPRGGHTSVANSVALGLAGVNASTPDPSGGSFGHLADGTLSGVLEGAANASIKKMIPPPPIEKQVANLEAATKAYAALGFGTIREALIERDQWDGYQAAWAAGRLSVRCRPMITVSPLIPQADRLELVRGLGFHSGFGDDQLRVWGLKFVIDGGVAGAALAEPFTDNPSYSGHLNWKPDELLEVGRLAVARGWHLASHAVGDIAVSAALDLYERILADRPEARGTLVLEHGILADASQRARAIRIGVPVTVQHYLLYANAPEMLRRWGSDRTARAFPVREWLAEGATVAAGSDSVHPFNPLLSVWGMETRGTRDAGIQGPEHAVDRLTAVNLYTRAAANLCGDGDRLGTIEVGKLADLVAYDFDPLDAPVDALREAVPVLTVVDGKATHDPRGLMR